MNIAGRTVTLRALESGDLPLLHAWANDPELQPMLGGWHFPTSLRDQEQWLQAQGCNSLHQRFAIDVPGHGCVGTANLVSIDWKNRSAFEGLLLGDRDVRGRGLGRDTVMALMRYAFEELGLVRLDTDIIEYNQPSLRLHVERCAWLIEGRKPQAYFRRGRWWEKVLLGITADRYRADERCANHWR